MEGVENVIIPCPIHTGLPPIWNINGNYYDINSLPQEYKPALIGIIIPTVYRDMNGTSFQCFYSTGDGLEVQQSSIGTLLVVIQRKLFYTVACAFISISDESALIILLLSDEEPLLTVVGNQERCLYLDHNSIYFGETSITIGIKPEQSTIDCNQFSLIARNKCVQDSPIIESWPFNGNNIVTINSMYTETSEGSLTFFDVVGGYNESTICRRGQAAFQIFDNGML